jgi:hypothetical protein
MILSDVFLASRFARDTEFTTLASDTPVVLQFAASNADDFASAAILSWPNVDGVDINVRIKPFCAGVAAQDVLMKMLTLSFSVDVLKNGRSKSILDRTLWNIPKRFMTCFVPCEGVHPR